MGSAHSTFRHAIRASVVLLAGAGGVEAQTDPVPIEVGRSVEAEILPSLPRVGGTPFRTFRLEARNGTRYEIQATSNSFEPEIRVGRSVGGVTDYLATASAQGMGAGAILEFEATASEPLVVLVRPIEGDGGPFALMVREPASGYYRPLGLDRPAAGVVGASAESFHVFSGSAGVEVEITVRSIDFDTYLEVGRTGADGFTALATDDDGAGGTDSRVYFIPPANGEYVARVTAYGSGGGAYAIVMRPPIELPPPLTLEAGRRVSAELSDASPRLDDEIPFTDWRITARRGERFRIDLESSDFDTYLAVGRMEGRRFNETTSNDDWSGSDLGDTDSRVVLVAREDGDYIVRVRSFASDQSGAYTLLATRLESARIDPLGGTIFLNTPVTGTLTETDARLDDGVTYQEWRVVIPAPGRYQFLLESSDFDTYLILGRMSESSFEELGSNDDWAESANGTDSRIAHTFGETGEFILRVRPFQDGFTGDYTLTASVGPPVRTDPTVGVVEVGQTVTGSLGEDDARIADSPYQEWLIRLDAEARTTITLESDDFDTYLAVGRREAGGFRELAANDDELDSTNSMLEFVAPVSAEYVIRVKPFSGDEEGEYQLKVSPR